MKNVAIIAAGASLCARRMQRDNADNDAANETAVENTASTDVNIATNDAAATATQR